MVNAWSSRARTQQAALHDWHGVSGQLPTCDNNYWFPCIEELVHETIRCLPLPMRLEHLLFQGGVQVPKREGGARTRDVSVLPPGLPVAAVTDQLAQQKQQLIKRFVLFCSVNGPENFAQQGIHYGLNIGHPEAYDPSCLPYQQQPSQQEHKSSVCHFGSALSQS